MLLKAIFSRKTRALLTILGVAVGIATFVSVRGVAVGVEHEWTRIYKAADIDLIVVGSAFMSRSVPESTVETLRALPAVREAFGKLFSIEAYGDHHLVVYGLPAAELTSNQLEYFEGGPPQDFRREVALGEICAEVTGKRAGDEIELLYEKYRVAGVFKSNSVYVRGSVVFELRELQRLLDEPERVTVIEVALTDKARATNAARDAAMAAIRAALPGMFVTPAEEIASSYQGLRVLRALTWGVSLIAVLLGVIGVTNTLTMSVLENTREIGILRALGWTWRRIFGLVLAESMTFSVIGGFVGCVFSEALTRALAAMPVMKGFISPELGLGLRAQGLAMAVVMGAICCLYPSWRVFRVDPIRALKYE